nr:DNA/RNA non-specific endonuclease [Vagococcus vulneris]
MLFFSTIFLLTGCAESKTDTTASTQQKSGSLTTTSVSHQNQAANETEPPQINQSELAQLDYQGTQTIEVNQNKPQFTDEELSLKNGSWEKYGDLDSLNRVTAAEAMLNQDLMPKEKRGDISKVTPTGWKNKKLDKGYLYNRSHLIGFALAGENDNWKNLMTGTQQLNNPEMLRHEMDVKYYLEQSPKNYVRYSVIPIFRDNELVARGVNMQAQSINSKDISFNIYIFNVQDGVEINYADGSSKIVSTENANIQDTNSSSAADSSAKEYVDGNGNGLIKGSKNKIYHLPGSKFYDRTTNPEKMFKTIKEAQDAGYRAAKNN